MWIFGHLAMTMIKSNTYIIKNITFGQLDQFKTTHL